jgi:hypothetical protein
LHQEPDGSAREPRRQRQRTDVEENPVQRVARAHTEGALRPRADRCNADRFRRSEGEERPEIDGMRQRQVRLASSERQIDLDGRGHDAEPEQEHEQPDAVELQPGRRVEETQRAGEHNRRHVRTCGGR